MAIMHYHELLLSLRSLISHLCLRTSTTGKDVGQDQPQEAVHQGDEKDKRDAGKEAGGVKPRPFFLSAIWSYTTK